MKKLIFTLVLLITILVITNPSINDFKKYVDKVTQSKIDETTGLEKVAETLRQSSIGALYKALVGRKSYIVFSTYVIDITGKEKIAYIGFLKVIFIKL